MESMPEPREIKNDKDSGDTDIPTRLDKEKKESISSLNALLNPEVDPLIKKAILVETDPLIIKGWEIETNSNFTNKNSEDTIYVTEGDVNNVNVFKEDLGRVKKSEDARILADIKEELGEVNAQKAEEEMEKRRKIGNMSNEDLL
jgi:hypothetical protein